TSSFCSVTTPLRSGYDTLLIIFLFFFNDTPTTEIYTLSLHDALPISSRLNPGQLHGPHVLDVEISDIGKLRFFVNRTGGHGVVSDRKSTRLNSSHSQISYAVFCLKKKKKN